MKFRFHLLWPLLPIILSGSGRAADLLEPGQPLVIEGTHGRFDFIAIDPVGRRLLAAHTGNSSLDVIDLDKGEVVKIVPTGAAQDVVCNAKAKRYYVSVSNPPQLAAVDAATLEVAWTVPLTGPADLLALDVKTGHVFVDHDDGKEAWVIDPAKKAIVATLELPSEGPEDLGFDSTGRRFFQCMKTAGTVAVFDTKTRKMTANWPTAPAAMPHGMAVVNEAGALLVAGGNGKLVLMSWKDGHVLSSAEIGERVDQIAYDAGLHRVYCASGTGKIVVVGVEKGKLTALGSVASSEGARSIAVDPKTHAVWVAYGNDQTSTVQAFTSAQTGR